MVLLESIIDTEKQDKKSDFKRKGQFNWGNHVMPMGKEGEKNKRWIFLNIW